MPKYSNALVKGAWEKLQLVRSQSLLFYPHTAVIYGLGRWENGRMVLNDAPSAAPKGSRRESHAFLAQLCGEYRDHNEMIEAKLKWVGKLNKLPIKDSATFDPKKPTWAQLSGGQYLKVLRASARLWEGRQDRDSGKTVKINGQSFSPSVPGNTVCEVKLILQKYVFPGKTMSSDPTVFEAELADYGAPAKGNCTADDHEWVYSYRGDSNFKIYSGESNGMIWNALARAEGCENRGKGIPSKNTGDGSCQAYYKDPFRSRWTAARNGLASWILHSEKNFPVFNDANSFFGVYPNFEKGNVPYGYKVDEKGPVLREWLKGWDPADISKPDFGLNARTGFDGSKGPDQRDGLFVKARLEAAVNRHANWYAAAYDDNVMRLKTQAYSPFIATSYEMSLSDHFTYPGMTISAPGDGFRHWMFVFKVRKQNYYTIESVAEGKPLDFDKQWYDETSIGTDSLATSERARDRLGSPAPEEFDAILYLHNITQSGQVTGDEEFLTQ
jgi:hypothetical protein